MIFLWKLYSINNVPGVNEVYVYETLWLFLVCYVGRTFKAILYSAI
jgi:hypothetical protein